MAKETELLDAILLYVKLSKGLYESIKFKEDSFAAYLDLFRIAPETLVQPQYQFKKPYEKYFEITDYFNKLRAKLDTQSKELQEKIGDPRANYSKIWATVTTLLFSMQTLETKEFESAKE